MEISQKNLNVDQIMEKIREEINKRKNINNIAKQKISNPIENQFIAIENKLIDEPKYQDFINEDIFPVLQSYHVNQFLNYNDRDFIINAFIGILRRKPISEELEYNLKQLRSSSLNKIEILWKLRTSHEGLIRCVSVRHITRKYYLNKVFKIFKNKIPLLKHLFIWFIAFIRLPKILKYIESVEKTNNIRYYTNEKVINKMFNKYTSDLNQYLLITQGNYKNVVLKIENIKDEILALNHSIKVSIENQFTGLSQQLNSIKIDSLELKKYVHENQENRITGLDQFVQKQYNDLKNQLNKFNLENIDKVNESNKRYNELFEHYNEINSHLNKLSDYKTKLDELNQILNENIIPRMPKIESQISENKQSIIEQEKSLKNFLKEAKKRLSEPFNDEQIQNMLKEEDNLQDAMYVFFENKFRGSRTRTKEKLTVYLPYIKEHTSKIKCNILDLGCGRGEWLELMKENGYKIKGVDINSVMIEECKKLDFDVIESDILEYLKKQKDNSISIITAFQIVEHLAFNKLIFLFDECLRVLKSKGMIIFETPNPENIIVGSNSFYIDPTHKKPLPPSTLTFFAEARGFKNIKVVRSTPLNLIEKNTDENLNELIKLFNIEQDYSIIGYKE